MYPGPSMPALERGRAAVLGEFGGLGLPTRGHTWQGEKNWGYVSFKDNAEYQAAYREKIAQLRLLVARGSGRSHLHPDDRRRDRGQRPDDLRSRGRQDSPAGARRDQQVSLREPAVGRDGASGVGVGRPRVALRHRAARRRVGRARLRRQRVAARQCALRRGQARGRPGAHVMDDAADLDAAGIRVDGRRDRRTASPRGAR